MTVWEFVIKTLRLMTKKRAFQSLLNRSAEKILPSYEQMQTELNY
jgi:hypothetical protein